MPIGDIYAIAAGFFWSFSVIFMRVSGFSIPPLALNFFKVCVTLICISILLLWEGVFWFSTISPEGHLRLILSAVLGIAVADTMIASALNRLGASLQALADCIYSPSIALIGFLMFAERLTGLELIGGALVISGVFVGATVTPEVRDKTDLLLGVILAAGAHIVMAVGILVVRDIFREGEVSIVWITGYRFLIAAIALLLWGLIRYPTTLQNTLFLGFRRPGTWKTMVPMAVTGPFLATLFWVAGFKYIPAGRAAIYNQLSTVFIIVLAYFFLKENFTKRKAVGTALAVAGSLVVALQNH